MNSNRLPLSEQGAPKRRKKVDAKCKTIESDPDFLQFVENKENLNKPDILPSVEECLEEIETKEKANKLETKITPLLEYINNAEHRKVTEIKKKSARDDGREKRRKDERVRKRKEKEYDRKKPIGSKPAASSKSGKELSPASTSFISVKSKAENREDGAAGAMIKEPRKRERHRRRHEDKKLLKSNDDKPAAAESKHGEKGRPEKSSSGRSNKSNAAKKEEPHTFTVRILKNENRGESKASDSSNVTTKPNSGSSKDSKPEKSEKSTDGGGSAKERRAPEKIRNKDRPTIQIYRPSPRSSTSQSKDQKETAAAAKKPSQPEKSARRGS